MSKWIYRAERIEQLETPEERVIAAAIVQSIIDFRITGYRDEIIQFFHGPLVGAAGLNGDDLMKMTAQLIKNSTGKEEII